MKSFSPIVLAAFLLLSPTLLLADDSGLADIARVSWKKNVKDLDQKIKSLSKRINEGVKSGVLSNETAQGLKTDVQALWDKKKEFMETNGAKVLTDDQLEKLRAMWKQTAKKIYQAKHPTAAASNPSEAR